MSCWSLTVGKPGIFTVAQCLIWTASRKTPGSVTQCHLNQDWLELSLPFAFPPSSLPAIFPGRFMNNEWGYMQAGAQILMELKNRRRIIHCAASHCFPTLLKLALPEQPLFTFPIPSLFFLSFLLLPLGWDEIMHSLNLSLLPRDIHCFPGCHSGGKGWTVTLKWEGQTFKLYKKAEKTRRDKWKNDVARYLR